MHLSIYFYMYIQREGEICPAQKIALHPTMDRRMVKRQEISSWPLSRRSAMASWNIIGIKQQ